MSSMRFDVLSLFPAVFTGFLQSSILHRAYGKGLVQYCLHDIRDYSEDRHHKVDERPYGGGPGMVLRCEPVVRAFESVCAMDARAPRAILLTPQGRTFHQDMARDMARDDRILLICGHYEGFDERIRALLPVEEVSIGDYVLSGGEAAAMVIIDAVVRLIPGVLGHEESAGRESFSDGLLDYPQYTRPPDYRGLSVPPVLLSGHHADIELWRRQEAEKKTAQRRADLWNASVHREG